MSPYAVLQGLPGMPWRVRKAMETMVEGRLRSSLPAVYRWLHFGRPGDLLRPLTSGPGHHFFGYYEKTPWNASQTLLLAHEVAFNDRAPAADDRILVGIVPVDGGGFQPLGETLAWNWQQGAMLTWHPADPERLLVHNDRRDGIAVGVVRDIDGREMRVYDRPIYAMSPDGNTAWSLNFARLATYRPGYGYAGLSDPGEQCLHSPDDGIFAIDLSSGRGDLIVSLEQLASLAPTPAMHGQAHWINHIQPNPNGSRIAFFHLWREGERGWGVRLYVARGNGTELRCVLDTGRISHYDWLDEDHIVVWARRNEGGERFLIVDVRDGSNRTFGEGILTEDGHNSFSPDRRWMLNDTYPDSHDMRTLMLIQWPQGRRIDIARTHSPKSRWWGEIRCDLHPRWSRDGRQVCVDSVHDGSRQIYVADVSRWVA